MPLEILHCAAPCRNVPVTFTLELMTREQLFFTAWGVVGVLALVMVPLRTRVHRLLRSRHRLVFEQLGRPGWGNANAWWSPGYWGYIKFVYGRRHVGLRDPELSRTSDWLLVLSALLYAAGFFIFAISSCAGLC